MDTQDPNFFQGMLKRTERSSVPTAPATPKSSNLPILFAQPVPLSVVTKKKVQKMSGKKVKKAPKTKIAIDAKP